MLLAGDLSYHNVLLPSDVDRNGVSTAIDILLIVNDLNRNGSRALYPNEGLSAVDSEGEAILGGLGNPKPLALDINNDGHVSAADALVGINRLNLGEGEGDVMKYVLKAVNDAGTAISTVSEGETFHLQVWVDDLRTGDAAEGVFAGYLDVLYDAAKVAVSSGASIVHGEDYPNSKSGDTTKPGVVDHAGSFASAFHLGPDPFLLWSLEFVATAPGVVTFTGEPTTDPTDPDDVDDPGVFGLDTLLLGENVAVCPTFNTDNQGLPKCLGSMGFDNVSITVVRDITAIDDQSTVTEDSINNTVDVLLNDILVNGSAKQLQSFAQASHGTVSRNDNGTPTDTSDDKLLYTPAANYFGGDSFTYTVNNGLGSTSVGTVAVTVQPLNDAPQNTVPGSQTTNEDQPFTFGNGVIAVSDVDADAGGGLQVALSVSHGKLTAAATNAVVSGNNSNTMTVTGLVADVNAALSALSYAPDGDYNGADNLQMVTDDLGHTGAGGAKSSTSTVAISIVAVNDPPVNHLPPSQVTDEDVPLVMSTANAPDNSLSISDADAGSDVIQVALTLGAASTGQLVLSSKVGLSFTDQDGDASMAFSGTLNAINAALAAGLTYTPASLFVGTENLAITTTSQGQSDSDVLVIDVIPTVRPRAINDTVMTVEDAAVVVVDVLANDRPNTGAVATLLTFTQPANGTVTLNGNGTSDKSDDTLSYVSNANFYGADSFTYSINDTSGQGADSTGTVAVTVQPVNDAPTLTSPGTQSIDEDGQLAFAAGAFSVADVDAAGANVTVSIGATMGVVSVATDGAVVQGSGTANITILGTLAQVNAALDGLKYQPDLNANGTEVLAVAVNDLGHTGSPGPLTVTGSVTIGVTAVNDAPVNSVPGTQSPFITNFDNILSAATGNAIQVSDVDAKDHDIVTNLSVTQGTFTVANTTLVNVAGNGTSSVTLTGPQDKINQTLAQGLVYRSAVEGQFVATVNTNDQGWTGANAALQDVDTILFDVLNFVPSTIGGCVHIWGDKDGDQAVDAGEVGAKLAGVKITLTGTDFRNQSVQLNTLTGADGRYVFSNLKPGSYQLRETQPYGVLDGADLFETPVVPADNDAATVVIGIRGGVNSDENNFTEVGLEARYLSIWHLLASSYGPAMNSGIVFSLGQNAWQSLTGPGWVGYQSARFELKADHQSGILYVTDAAGQLKQATVTLSSGRMRPSADYQLVTIIGSASDFQFTNVPAGEGEGLVAAMDAYQRGVDAAFAGYGSDAEFA